jgi:flagellar protein FliO/FliZ
MRLALILPGLMTGVLVSMSIRAETEKPVSSGLAPSPLGGGVLLETAGGLLLILALIFAISRLLRRFGRLPMASKGDIQVLSGVSLGPRERAVLLRVGGTRLLVGVAPGRVQTLHVLADADTANQTDVRFSGQLESEMTGQGK